MSHCAVFPSRVVNFDGNLEAEDYGGSVLLGEFGSMQMELYLLSKRLGIPELADLADYPTRFLNQTQDKKV